jgi:large subunit ribosomal protein L9
MVQVIFLENVEDYKVGEVRDVSDGYARNYLLPGKKACVASSEKLNEIEANLAKIKKEEAEKVQKAKELSEKLKALKIKLVREVNEDGHLYGSITNREIADKLLELKFEIDPANIEIENPIKELGEHEVLIKVGHGIETVITVSVDRLESK